MKSYDRGRSTPGPVKHRPTIPAAAIWLLAWLTANSARSATSYSVVDQSIIVPVQGAVAVTASQSLGQSFTVGLGGPLTRIDFQLGRNANTAQPLQVQVRTTIGDLPNLDPSALLFSGSIPAANVPVLSVTTAFATTIDLSSAPPLVGPGEKLVVLLFTTDSDWYNWDSSAYLNSNPYPYGTAVKLGYPDPSNWVTLNNWDFGFQTWVAVPEPCSLFPAGLLILGLYRLRARSSRKDYKAADRDRTAATSRERARNRGQNFLCHSLRREIVMDARTGPASAQKALARHAPADWAWHPAQFEP